jgi:hypothetical protein
MSTPIWMSIAHAFRRAALPLAAYYGVTLVVPLVNGAARAGAFADHALVVLIVPPVATILACAVQTIGRGVIGACRALRPLLPCRRSSTAVYMR